MVDSRLEKLGRLNNARDALGPVMEDSRQWNNQCERVFSQFRLAVIHVRNDQETLDAVEHKEVAWRFLCKLSRDRHVMWARCEEVLHILKGSDAWIRVLVDDPEASVTDLPTNVIKEFDSRCEEVSKRCSKHIHLALIGCGPAALRHCEFLARHNERVNCAFFQIVALVDKVPQRIEALREIPQASALNLRAAEAFDGVEALFKENCDFDAAALLSHTDRERVLPALLARGKFVFAEPPLVSTGVEAANRLAKMSRQPPGSSLQRLLVAEPFEYAPELMTALGHLEVGNIGDVFGADARGSWAGEEASEMLTDGIGSTLVPGLRLIRALRHLVGPVEEVIAVPQNNSAPSGGRTSSFSSKNPNNPFGQASREPAGPETSTACILRHKGGLVSTLRLHSRQQKGISRAFNIVVNGSDGDLVMEGSRVVVNTDVSRQGRRPSSSARLQELSPGEHLWALFASQVAPIARGQGDPLSALQRTLEANPNDVAKNLEAHIADLAVAEALRSSFQSRRFELVQVPGIVVPASFWD